MGAIAILGVLLWATLTLSTFTGFVYYAATEPLNQDRYNVSSRVELAMARTGPPRLMFGPGREIDDTMCQESYDARYTECFCGRTESSPLTGSMHLDPEQVMCVAKINTFLVHAHHCTNLSNTTVDWAHNTYLAEGDVYTSYKHIRNHTFTLANCTENSTFLATLVYPDDPYSVCLDMRAYLTTDGYCGAWKQYGSALFRAVNLILNDDEDSLCINALTANQTQFFQAVWDANDCATELTNLTLPALPT